ALAKKRDDRYSSMEELVQALDEFVASTKGPAPKKPGKKVALGDMPSGHLFERRYLIEKRLREGISSVYKAIDKMLEVPVALKIINTETVEDPKSIERLKRGIILARRVTNPNVVRIYDVGETEGGLYVSMEFVEGKPLSELMRVYKRMTPEQVLPLVKQM